MRQYLKDHGFAFDTTSGKKWKGLLYGIIYGLLAKVIFSSDQVSGAFDQSGLTTISFIFLVPFVIGLMLAFHLSANKTSGKLFTVLMAAFTVTVLFIVSAVFWHKEMVYTLIAYPAYLFMALAGSLSGSFIFSAKQNKGLLWLCLFIPFIIAPLEGYISFNDQVYQKRTSIDISGTDSCVWENMVRVKEITEAESGSTLFQFAGFPRPIRAEFDTIAVGGERKAVFNRGLLFTETITEVVPRQFLRFAIKADPGAQPLSDLEKQVIIDGKYFEVLEGRYEIEKTGPRNIRLHFTSKYRLSTRFNFYGNFWARLIMQQIQKDILAVVKHRSEIKR